MNWRVILNARFLKRYVSNETMSQGNSGDLRNEQWALGHNVSVHTELSKTMAASGVAR